jgi:hypothetical protein
VGTFGDAFSEFDATGQRLSAVLLLDSNQFYDPGPP